MLTALFSDRFVLFSASVDVASQGVKLLLFRCFFILLNLCSF